MEQNTGQSQQNSGIRDRAQASLGKYQEKVNEKRHQENLKLSERYAREKAARERAAIVNAERIKVSLQKVGDLLVQAAAQGNRSVALELPAEHFDFPGEKEVFAEIARFCEREKLYATICTVTHRIIEASRYTEDRIVSSRQSYEVSIGLNPDRKAVGEGYVFRTSRFDDFCYPDNSWD